MRKILFILFIVFILFLVGCTQKEGEISRKDINLWTKAANNLDLKICDKMSDKFGQQLCYLEIGVKLNDPSICDRLIFQDKKEECLINFN